MKQCPVCKVRFIKQGFINHIINSAKGELFRYLNYYLNESKTNPSVKSAVLSNKCKHLTFYRKNIRRRIKFQFDK